MDITRLYEILDDTTQQIRKGEILHGSPNLVEQASAGEPLSGGGVLTIDMMPSASEVPDRLEKVDCHFLLVGVDRSKAEDHREELVSILNCYPEPARLTSGPSYIEVGGVIGDQGAAFQLFALGETLGFWKVITPERMGFNGEMAEQMAGQGFVMISGFKP